MFSGRLAGVRFLSFNLIFGGLYFTHSRHVVLMPLFDLYVLFELYSKWTCQDLESIAATKVVRFVT